MDPALQRQRSAFLERAKSQSSFSKFSDEAVNSTKKKTQKRKISSRLSSSNTHLPDFDYKAAQSSSSAVFGTLAKIVDYMKKRHLNQQPWALTFNEILEEVQVYDLSKRSKLWLTEVLPKNRRISVESCSPDDVKYIYKPPYKIKGRNTLLSVLKRHDLEGKGGVLLSDLNECVINAEKMAQSLGDAMMEIPTQLNKRKDRVYFYNDPESAFAIDDEFRALWRSVAVDHIDEKKVEEYLQKHGIDTMRDLAPKKPTGGPPKRKAMKRRANSKVHNEHLNDVLEDYVMD